MRIELSENGVAQIYLMNHSKKGEVWFKEIGAFPDAIEALRVIADNEDVQEHLRQEQMVISAVDRYNSAYKVYTIKGRIVRIDPRQGFYYKKGTVYANGIDDGCNYALYKRGEWVEVVESLTVPIQASLPPEIRYLRSEIDNEQG